MVTTLIKLVLLASTVLIGITATRRGRLSLAQIDAGTRCIRCEGEDTTVEGDRVRCNACGQTASLSKLRGITITDAELDAATKPDDRGPFGRE